MSLSTRSSLAKLHTGLSLSLRLSCLDSPPPRARATQLTDTRQDTLSPRAARAVRSVRVPRYPPRGLAGVAKWGRYYPLLR